MILGIWAVVSGLEWLSNRGLLEPKGLFDWSVVGSRAGFISNRPINRLVSSTNLFILMQMLRVGSGLFIILMAMNAYTFLALLSIAVCCCFTVQRCYFGSDGSDQMGLIVSVGGMLIAAGNAWGNVGISLSGIVLITGQLLLSYFVAGVAKLISRIWRHGEAITGIMATEVYGHRQFGAVVKEYRIIALTLSWLTIALEVSFPCVVVVPLTLALVILCMALIFHIGNAVFMGLNTFALSFPAAYPAVVATNIIINNSKLLHYSS